MDMKIEHGLLKVKGKYYLNTTKDGKEILVEVDKKIVNRKLRLVGILTKKLKDGIDKEIIMKEALMNLDFKDLKKLDNVLKSKRKYKPRTREGACADMKVGNFIIPIINTEN